MNKYEATLNRSLWALMAAAALAAAGAAWAADTPARLDGATVVDAAKAKALKDAGAIVVDTRVAAEYAEAHIAGAIGVPYKEKSAKAADADLAQDTFDLSKLPGDKLAVLVMYCNGPECWKSYKASKAAVRGGYKKVNWFRGGFPEWKAKGLPFE